MRNPTILEVALNGPWGSQRQPGIPVSVQAIVAEGIACAKAGASVIHVHPYDESTGRQCDEHGLYAAIIDGIRAEVDALVYPTAPFVDDDGNDRYEVTERLAREGRIEWATVDPGSLNIARFDEIDAGHWGFVYRNSGEAMAAGLAMARATGLRPSFACYEPGQMRFGHAMHSAHPGCPEAIYRLMFSQEFAFGLPPTQWALKAWAKLIDCLGITAPIMVAGLGVDIRPLIPTAVQLGWHVRVGKEDAPFGHPLSNLQWVQHAAHAIRQAGGELATPSECKLDRKT